MVYVIMQKIFYKLFLRNFKPETIAYKDSKKRFVKDTRVSNTTHLSNKENITLGENVFIGHFNYVDGYKKINVGNGCQITNYVSIVTHSSHNAIRILGEKYIDSVNTKTNVEIIESGPITIGEYTYVGPHTTIMPNSRIGKGCIISAYSYVSGEFPDYSIIRGRPAKIIGDTRQIDDNLLRIHPEYKDYYFNNENN